MALNGRLCWLISKPVAPVSSLGPWGGWQAGQGFSGVRPFKVAADIKQAKHCCSLWREKREDLLGRMFEVW